MKRVFLEISQNFGKFLRTSFSIEQLWWLLLHSKRLLTITDVWRVQIPLGSNNVLTLSIYNQHRKLWDGLSWQGIFQAGYVNILLKCRDSATKFITKRIALSFSLPYFIFISPKNVNHNYYSTKMHPNLILRLNINSFCARTDCLVETM